MDGEFRCSKCCNLDNPYLSIPLGWRCCATSVAMLSVLITATVPDLVSSDANGIPLVAFVVQQTNIC